MKATPPRSRKAPSGWPRTVAVGNARVRIYRVASRSGYVAFQVANYSTGRRRLESFADEREALRRAEQVARQLSAGEVTAAGLRSGDAASYGRALELLRPSGASLEVAAAAYAKAFNILGGDALIEAANFYARHRVDAVERRRVADVVIELVAAKESRGASARYLADLRSRLNRFAHDFAVDVSSVTTGDVQRWLDGLKVAPQTAKNFRTVLGTLFSFAESRGYIFKGGNPVEDTESISGKGGEITIYSPAEIGALLKAASVDFLPMLALGAFAGLRSAELERAEWQDVDLPGGFVHVGGKKAKTRSRRLVPILPNLAAWLAPYARRKGKVWPGTDAGLRDARAATVEAASVGWKPNALRHSFISYRLADIQDAAKVSLEAGNSPAIVFRHYRELVKPDAARAWFAIVPDAPANVVTMKGATP